MLRKGPPLWLSYSLIAGALFALSFYIPRDTAFPPGNAVANSGQATLDVLQEIMKLVLSLNTVMLTAAGALFVKAREWKLDLGYLEVALLLCVFLCGAVSYFGVYNCQMRILTMVNYSAINPLELGLLNSLRLQYAGLILGVFLLGLVFALLLGPARKKEG